MTTMWTLEDLGLLDQVDPALVEKLHEARRLPSRLERMYPRTMTIWTITLKMTSLEA